MRVKTIQFGRNSLTIVVKRVKGRLYVYDEYRLNGKVVTNYIGPLDEMARIFQIYKSLGKVEKLSRRDLRRLAKMIVEELARKLAVNQPQKTKIINREGAGPRGFEPRVSGLGGRRPIQARLRALFLIDFIFRD